MSFSITPRHCSSGTDAMLKFFTSGVDVAYMGVVPYALARMYGMPLRALQSSGRWTEAVCLRKKRGRDGGPRRIATVQGSNAHLLAWAWAREHDERVLFIDLEPTDQLVALQTGLVDGVSTWEPFVSRAVTGDVEMVFSSEDLTFPVTDLLVCSEAALENSGELVASLQRVHRDCVDRIIGGLEENDQVILSSLLGVDFPETWLRQPPFPAPPDLRKREPAALQAMMSEVQGFLVESGLAAGLPMVDGDQWAAESTGSTRSSDHLVVGYSSDLMCAPFYLAQFTNAFESEGITVHVPKDLLAERIARMNDAARAELRGVQDLLETDPELAVMKIGRIVERELMELHGGVFTTPAPRRISATIAELEESEVLPPLLASSVDWIRRMRNVATHGAGTSSNTAAKAFAELLGYLEWAVLAKPDLMPRCGRCKAAIERTWKNCPACTAELVPQCRSCGMAMKTGWKICPTCG